MPRIGVNLMIILNNGACHIQLARPIAYEGSLTYPLFLLLIP